MNHRRSSDRPHARAVGSVLPRWAALLSITVVVQSVACVQQSPQPSVEQAVSILVALLSDESADIRRASAESLGKIGDRSAIVAVANLLTEPSSVVRAAAATAAGRLGADAKEVVTPSLLHALRDPNDAVRRAAAEALGELEPPRELLGIMPELLASSDVEVRRAAALVLLQIDSTGWLASLYKLIQDPDPLVRQRTVAVLGEIGTAKVYPVIRERLAADPDPAVRAEAAYRLRIVSDKAARAALKRSAETDSDPTVRRWARADE